MLKIGLLLECILREAEVLQGNPDVALEVDLVVGGGAGEDAGVRLIFQEGCDVVKIPIA